MGNLYKDSSKPVFYYKAEDRKAKHEYDFPMRQSRKGIKKNTIRIANKTVRLESVYSNILLSLVILSMVYLGLTSPYNMDDVWCYSFSHYIVKGMLPYRDFNVIVGPLSIYLYALPLYFQDNIYTFYIGGVITNILTYILFFKVFNCFRKGEHLIAKTCASAVCIILSSWMTKTNYNTLMELFCLAMVYLCLTSAAKNIIEERTIVLLSILSSFGILTKQSTGLFLACAAFFSICIISSKLGVKYILKTILIYIVDTSGIIALAIAWMIKAGIFDDFIDINMGISMYTVSNTHIIACLVVYLTLLASTTFMMVRLVLKTRASNNELHFFQKHDPRFVIIWLFHIFMNIAIYPLPNFGHIITTWFLSLVLMSLYMYYFRDELIAMDKIGTILSLLFILAPIGWYIISAGMFDDILLPVQVEAKTQTCYEPDHIYTYLDEHTDLINDYINSDPVHKYQIIHETAVLCNIKNDDRYTKYLDMFNDGNLGTNSALELVRNSDCDYFIVSADQNDVFWQYNSDAMTYIYSLEKVATINCKNGPAFAVYKNDR